LNFVNNFSEVNAELAQEIREAVRQGNMEEVQAIAMDIFLNQQKICDHGKRADAIVKSMLQHSKLAGGEKEPTDVNALCEEYLGLAHHGAKARDKEFNVALETHFDTGLPTVDVIPQEIGRVLLNLLNNAFYAVWQRKCAGAEHFEPRVILNTRTADGQVIIEVRDNGPGIPVQIRDKIFQPFFTTKPTGQGTGLGLSLSYDIIHAHGGTLTLVQSFTEGSVFEIRLPVNPSM
jgi:signal transduction histidine kinase